MKKLLLLTGALLALTASVASAQIDFNWDDCVSTPTSCNKQWACNGNTGTDNAVSSFISPAALTAFVATGIIVRVDVEAPATTDWWSMGTGGCHAGGMGADGPANQGLATCLDPYAGSQGGGQSFDLDFYGASDSRYRGDWAGDAPSVVPAGANVYAQVTLVRHTKSTGTGSCAGCDADVVLTLTEVGVYQVAGTPPQDTYLLQGNEQIGYNRTDCPGGVVPAKNETWGSIKALYR